MTLKEHLNKILDDMEEQKLRNEIDLEVAENIILITTGQEAVMLNKKIFMHKMAIQSYTKIIEVVKKRIEKEEIKIKQN